MLDYIRDAAEIYRQSFAAIRAEADLARFPADVARVVVRLIHTCGQVDVADHVAYTDDVVARAHAALRAGAPVLCDSSMVAAGITAARLPADNEVVSLVADPRAAERAARTHTTRSAAGVDLWANRLPGAVVAIGNAPTALFRLLEPIDEGVDPPAAVLGGPVGFVGRRNPSRSSSSDPAACRIWWCKAAAAAVPWPPRPSTRSRTSGNDRAGHAVGCRVRTR